MAVVRYLARRELLLGVSNGQQVTYTLPMVYAGRSRARAAQATTRVSMAGKRETYYYRGEVRWQISFYPVNATEMGKLSQFLASVEDGQIFSFAPDGKDTTPSPAYRDVAIDPASFSETQHPMKQELVTYPPITLVEVP